MILEMVYAVTVSGEYPTLFSNDELEGFLHVSMHARTTTRRGTFLLVVLQALAPAIKKDFPNSVTDPLEYFKARIRCNMRLIICVSPDCFLVKDEAL